MIPELGTFAIILAFCFALVQCGSSIFTKHFQFSVMAAFGQFIFLALAMLFLIVSFLNNDMTVAYVVEHSHQLLPFLYRVGAAWGGHEGSLLLWCLILSGWTLAFILFSFKKLKHTGQKILVLLGVISVGFIAFLLFTSNPFKRLFPTTLITGDDLAPILQDPGLIFHPPMLYLGYVGFALGFAFAMAALIEGKFDKLWVQTLRPWIILPWGFLSCGIVLGSWWAYRELGWGGWWFWDPVENASLLPWLSATALLHALIVSEKRNAFKAWTLFLAILTFALSLLGTFLVRSGILVSVHAFASDPTRGIFLLSYLTLLIGGSLGYYAYKMKHFYQAPGFSLFSRETFLLVNTVILLTAVITISLGTLYPIALDALGLGKISVGEPYFNTVFLPIILPLLLLMGFAPHVKWGQHSFWQAVKKLALNIVLTLVATGLIPFFFDFEYKILPLVGIFFSLWIITGTLQYCFTSGKWKTRSHWSMIVAHIGIGILALGVTINKSYSEERQIKMKPGESVFLAGHQFTLNSLTQSSSQNYESIVGIFSVSQGQHNPNIVTAEQRIYKSHEQTLSHPGISVTPWRDLYIALGAPLKEDSWSVRIYVKPFVRWIWAGGFLLLMGGLLSLIGRQKKVMP